MMTTINRVHSIGMGYEDFESRNIEYSCDCGWSKSFTRDELIDIPNVQQEVLAHLNVLCEVCEGAGWDWKKCADEDREVDDPVDEYQCELCGGTGKKWRVIKP